MERKIKRQEVYMPTELKVRAMGDGTDSRIIEGYALKFNVRSRLLCDWFVGGIFYEVLESGCVTMEMLNRQDIKLTMFHNREIVLARSKEGKGTLNYEVDEVGVKFWAEMPLTQHGTEALELVKRGDIAGCSFIYSTDEDTGSEAVSYERIKEGGEDILLRHVLRIDNVYDFTVTTDPAYEQTTVTKREVEDAGVTLEPNDDDNTAQPQDGDGGKGGEGDDPDKGKGTDPDGDGQKRQIDLTAKRKTIRQAREKIEKIFV